MRLVIIPSIEKNGLGDTKNESLSITIEERIIAEYESNPILNVYETHTETKRLNNKTKNIPEENEYIAKSNTFTMLTSGETITGKEYSIHSSEECTACRTSVFPSNKERSNTLKITSSKKTVETEKTKIAGTSKSAPRIVVTQFSDGSKLTFPSTTPIPHTIERITNP